MKERRGAPYPYRYVWRANGKYKNYFRQRCRVLARGALNSACVEFRSGRREIVSRNALRKAALRAGNK